MTPSLRDDQLEFKHRLYVEMRTNRAVLGVAPTGTGKSHIIAEVGQDAMKHDRSMLVVVHRIELVGQLIARLREYGVQSGTLEDALAQDVALFGAKHKVYVSMVQSLRPGRIPTDINLVMFDEAHHCVAATYKRVIEAIPDAKVLGVTATPERRDGQGLGDIFGSMVLAGQVKKFIDLGVLVPTEVLEQANMRRELERLSTRGGEYKSEEVEAWVRTNVATDSVVKAYQAFGGGEQCILFADSVANAEYFAQAYRDAGVPSVAISGKTPKTMRDLCVEAFRRGEVRVLTNAQLVTEGFDVPGCSVVQDLAPGLSLGAYLQKHGRSKRADKKNGKTKAIYLDHVSNAQRHGHPDDDRAWTLKGQKRTKNTWARNLRFVDVAGAGVRRIEMVKGDPTARKLVGSPVRIATGIDSGLMRLVYMVEEKGWKDAATGGYNYGWAYRKWLETLKTIPSEDSFRWFAKKAGKSEAWVQTEYRRWAAPKQVTMGGIYR